MLTRGFIKMKEETKEALIAEYKLIQEKKSTLSAKERAKVCAYYDIYKAKGLI
jgi:hypothetical protein